MAAAQIPPFNFKALVEDIANLSKEAGVSPQASMKFYKSGVRTQFFKLEALCRLFKSAITKQPFEELLTSFKQVEDQLGEYDYHEALYVGISSKEDAPAEFVAYFKKRMDDAQRRMTKSLKEEYWIPVDAGKYDAILKTLELVAWPSLEKIKDRTVLLICKELNKIRDKYEKGELDPHNIDEGLHEIRRKLRWISMYAQVMDGMIQMKEVKSIPEENKMYLTEEVLNSPFNKLPPPMKGISPLLINSDDFYALSWIIAALGDLKDQALKEEAITSALKACKITEKTEVEKIRTLYNAPEGSAEHIADIAEILLDQFIYKNRIPDRIVRSLNRSSKNPL